MQYLSLEGKWQVTEQGADDPFPAQVPGTIHSDLLAAGRIDDPFHRDNEMALQWIGDKDWVYDRNFDVPASLLEQDRVLLRCEGLDTLATITINGTEVGKTDNQFRAWEFDVKAMLVEGENHIQVYFTTPVPYMAEKERERSMGEFLCAPHEKLGRAYVRKMPCNFGWDWGPVLVECGIWKAIGLVGVTTGRLSDVAVRQDHQKTGRVDLQVAVEAETTGKSDLSATVTVQLDGNQVAQETLPLTGGAGTAQFTITDPQLWWPNGMGDQPLYHVTVTLDDGGVTLDTWQKRIGLRTLKLDRHADEWGECFQFLANGVPFFAKGGNWVPIDALYTRNTPERYRDLLQSCADANINMIRIWGGGLYESDAMYDVCDELGICIWQDFIFTVSLYPLYDEVYLANTKAEAEDNVRRLRHHASLCLWCGNNEMEHCNFMRHDPAPPDKIRWVEYSRLIEEILPGVVERLNPETDYWPSSPHTPGDNRINANDDSRGDTHIWAVWHGREPFEWYRNCKHRFNSEFGFQSFPEPLTAYSYTEEEDRNVTTQVMEHHQRCGPGNTIIMQYMLDWFRLPTSFEMSLWLSQVQQGMAMKYAIEHWRRSMPRGMGTLYWQINDNWPVASWSSLDYFGRWKALHYMAKAFYAPLLISGLEDLDAGTVEIHLTSDLGVDHAGEAEWNLVSVGGETVASGKVDTKVAARTNVKVTTLDLSEHLKQHRPQTVLLEFAYLENGQRITTNLVHFVRPKHVRLQEPNISVKIDPKTETQCTVTLTAEKPALWAWLAMDGVALRCSANYMHLMPGVPVSVDVEVSEPLSAAQWQTLKVFSLIDTYRPGGVPALQ